MTQGIVSVADESGKTIFKIIVGCNGYNHKDLVNAIKAYKNPLTVEDIYLLALQEDFGCGECLVVMDKDREVTNESDNSLPRFYRETFENPEWNPRWEHGTANYVNVIKTALPKGDIK